MSTKFDILNYFDEEMLSIELTEGIIYNYAHNRVCILSSDLLQGALKSLKEEAGEAWAPIFRRCGRLWGDKLSERLDRETLKLGGTELGQMSVKDFVRFIEEYFLFHGWGCLSLDLEKSQSQGLIEGRLDHSAFCEIFSDTQENVHPMICGILGGLFSKLSGQDLDCLETECTNAGGNQNRFIITARGRIEPFVGAISMGSHEEILSKI